MLDSAQLLAELVAVRSVNPLLSTGGPDDERQLGEHVAGLLRSWGVETELQEVKDGRCNVIGHLPRRGAGDDAVVLLTAHMDTYPQGGPSAAYQPVRDGTMLYGRGSADAKGSLASMLAAFHRAARAPDRRESFLAATIDEECLLLGANALAQHHMRPTLAVTGEPTGLVPIVAQKGIIRGSMRVRGPKAHAAYPKPRTAITAATDLVEGVRRINADYAATATAGDLSAPTLTLTRIDSDGGMNLAAEEVTVWFDGRFLPGVSGEEFAAEIVGRLRTAVPADLDFAMNELSFISPPNRCPTGNPILAEFFTAVKDVTGRCEPETFAYGSEAGVLAGFSAASLVFGPGDARFSHGEIEGIDLTEVNAAVQIFERLLIGGVC
ncbi:M20 family metallopeptidase [Dactylosporangium sp. NPDC051541]|uniref:M20 family metallopeptidase n=1 Tax=Dactylosporangium sp. NPDC051541 TaxID=3363977 RepID=UPI0037B03906